MSIRADRSAQTHTQGTANANLISMDDGQVLRSNQVVCKQQPGCV